MDNIKRDIKKYKISVDWDDTLEHNYVKNEVVKWLKMDHDVEIVTTRYRDPSEYPWYREGIDDDLHKALFKFARHYDIPYHFTNMEWKAKYLEENNFDFLIDDNPDEKKGLIKCEFILTTDIHEFTKRLKDEEG